MTKHASTCLSLQLFVRADAVRVSFNSGAPLQSSGCGKTVHDCGRAALAKLNCVAFWFNRSDGCCYLFDQAAGQVCVGVPSAYVGYALTTGPNNACILSSEFY